MPFTVNLYAFHRKFLCLNLILPFIIMMLIIPKTRIKTKNKIKKEIPCA